MQSSSFTVSFLFICREALTAAAAAKADAVTFSLQFPFNHRRRRGGVAGQSSDTDHGQFHCRASQSFNWLAGVNDFIWLIRSTVGRGLMISVTPWPGLAG